MVEVVLPLQDVAHLVADDDHLGAGVGSEVGFQDAAD